MQPASLRNDDDDAKDDTEKTNEFIILFRFSIFLDLFITPKILN